jgi:hypothetical protein
MVASNQSMRTARNYFFSLREIGFEKVITWRAYHCCKVPSEGCPPLLNETSSIATVYCRICRIEDAEMSESEQESDRSIDTTQEVDEGEELLASWELEQQTRQLERQPSHLTHSFATDSIYIG